MTPEITKNIPLFSPEELDANEKRKKELINSIKSNESILFVGSGLSTHECPDWKQLLLNLENVAFLIDDSFQKDAFLREKRPLEYADKIKDAIKLKYGDYGRYEVELQHMFSKKNCLDIHRKLFKIPFLGFITTNYDMILESALIESKQNSDPINCWFTLEEDNALYASDFLRSLNNATKKPKSIAHIHGVYKYPSKIILSYRDYVKNYGFDNKGDLTAQPKIHYSFLHTIFSTKNVVFIGFSMDDPFIKLMLRIVCSNYHLWNSISHTFITDINGLNKLSRINNSKQFLNDFAISTIFYENEGGNHLGLEDIIDRIINELKSEHINYEIEHWARGINEKMIYKGRAHES